MICFVVALYSEAENVIKNIEGIEKTSISGKEIYKGLLFGKQIVLALSGIGKVNASLTTQMLIDKFKPSIIINFGTAGGIDNSVKAKEYYVVDKAFQFDFDITEIDNVPIGFIQGYDDVFFKCNTQNLNILPKISLATADRFTDKKEFIEIIKDNNCKIRDMEGSAIAQVCTSNDCPILVIKGVSDVMGNKSSAEQFKSNMQAVSLGFPTIICKAIKNLK